MTGAGWRARPAGRHTAEFAYLAAFGVDIAFDQVSHALFVASNQIPSATWIYILDVETLAQRARLSVPGTWRDDRPSRKAPTTARCPPVCDRITLSVFKGDAPGNARFDVATTWDLALAQASFRLDPPLCAKP